MAEVRSLEWLLGVKDQASGAISKIDSSVTGLSSKLTGVGKKMQSMGKPLMKGVTAPLVAVGTASLKTVSDFDDGMSRVRSLTGATGAEFDKLREKAIQLGNDTAYSAMDASEGMQVLSASGMATNDILETSSDMFSLMSAGSTDADTAASILTNTMAQFNLKASDSTAIVDTFAKGAASAKLGVEDLEYIMGQAGSTLSSMNMDMQQSVAMAGQLANAGMPIGQVGSALNSLGRDIKANAGDFKALGVEVYDAATGQLRGADSVLADLQETLKGKTDAERDAALASVFSGQSMKAATSWLALGSDAYNDLTEEIYNATGASAEMAAMNEDNIGGAIRSLKSSLGTLMINIGDVLKGPIQQVANFIGNLASKFNALDPATQKLIVGIGAVAAAIGPVLFFGGKVMVLAGQIAAYINPITIAIAAVTGVLLHLWRTNEGFRENVIGIWQNIQTIVLEVIEVMQTAWQGHGAILMETFRSIASFITGAIETMVALIGNAVGIIAAIIEGDWAAAWDNAKALVETFINWLKGVPGMVLDIGKGIGKSLWSGIKSAGGFVGGIVGKFTGAGGKADGSHRTGKSRVPFDGYKAVLHKNEEVLTADDPRNINNNKTLSNNTTFSPNITVNASDSTSANEIAAAVRRELEMQFMKLNLKGV